MIDVFTPPAVKDIKRLKENAGKMLKAINELAADPSKGHTLEGTLRGVRSLEHNLPGGAYRAAYVLLARDKVCLVFVVGPHEGFYDKATRSRPKSGVKSFPGKVAVDQAALSS